MHKFDNDKSRHLLIIAMEESLGATHDIVLKAVHRRFQSSLLRAYPSWPDRGGITIVQLERDLWEKAAGDIISVKLADGRIVKTRMQAMQRAPATTFIMWCKSTEPDENIQLALERKIKKGYWYGKYMSGGTDLGARLVHFERPVGARMIELTTNSDKEMMFFVPVLPHGPCVCRTKHSPAVCPKLVSVPGPATSRLRLKKRPQ